MAKPAAEVMNTVTLSLPRRLVEYADRCASARGVSRSKIVAQALAQAAADELDDLAAEGYRFYAEESRQFAEGSLAAVSESLDREE